MGLIDLFRKRPPIESLSALDDFVDGNTAFLVQKCIYEYCRVRSGVLASKLFKEPSFIAAMDDSRWRSFPICLGHVTQMVADTLRPHTGGDTAGLTDGMIALADRAMNRFPIPPSVGREAWTAGRERVAERLRSASLAAPKAVKDIPIEDYQVFFDQLPIHEKLRGHDFVLVRNNLRVNLCRAYEDFIAVADLPRLARLVIAGPQPVAPPRLGGSRG
jgi:hypothetical protein